MAQIINKKSGEHQFTQKDEEVNTPAHPIARYQQDLKMADKMSKVFCGGSVFLLLKGDFRHPKTLLRFLDSLV